MLTRDDAKQITDAVLSVSDADETEVFVGGGDFALSRFANNIIHQNVSEERTVVSVRVVQGQKTARVTTTRTDKEGLADAVARAKKAASLSKDDPDLLPMPGPEDAPAGDPLDAYDDATAALSPADRAAKVKTGLEATEKAGFTAAGYFSNNTGDMGEWGESGIYAIGNSKGRFEYYRGTEAGFSLTAFTDDSSGWVYSSARRAEDIPVADLGARAAELAALAKDPQVVEPGKYTVIIPPTATGELFWYLAEAFNGQSVDEGRSAFSGKQGEKLLSESITIHDDPYHELTRNRPFDGEGIPTKKVALVENGVLKGFVWDRKTAKKVGVEPTGHGLPVPNIMGAWPSSLVIGGGSTTVDEMVANTERGILVTRFWYIRLVDPKKLIVTGMTRDGTFLVEGGKIKCGLKNLRFNESILHMLGNVAALGPQERVERYAVPAMTVNDFNFTSVTLF